MFGFGASCTFGGLLYLAAELVAEILAEHMGGNGATNGRRRSGPVPRRPWW
jgi:hypothetical protein